VDVYILLNRALLRCPKSLGKVLPGGSSNPTKANRRLQGEGEIEGLRLLGRAAKAGHTIKNPAKLTTAEFPSLDSNMEAKNEEKINHRFHR
jgi:hypothetical protein